MAIDVNAKSTTDLINAFEAAQAENKAASSAVANAASALAGGWSGAAAGAYMNSISQWLEGLGRVQNALVGLQDNMVAFTRNNQSTEDDALTDATSWATSASLPNQSSWT